MVYLNEVEHIKERADEACDALGFPRYEVVAERKLNAVDPRVIVVSQLAGNVGKTTADIPCSITMYVNDPAEGLAILGEIAKRNASKIFDSVVEDADGNAETFSIVETYTTPTIMDLDVVIGSNHAVRIVQYATFYVMADVLDVKEIGYKGEKIEFAQATIAYVAQLSANNKSGESLMKSTATGAAISLSITMPAQRNPLATDAIKVMVGECGKNTAFPISLSIGSHDPMAFSKRYLISACTMNSVRGGLPSLQVSFSEFDE